MYPRDTMKSDPRGSDRAVGVSTLPGTAQIAAATASSAHQRRMPWVSHQLSRTWVPETVVLVALAVAYNVVRAMPGSSSADAYHHARAVLRIEGWSLFDHLEIPLNSWLSGSTMIAIAACYFYAVLHYAATPIVFVLSRRRGGWQYWRGYWSLVLASAIALAVYALYPVAPPRLVPDLDIVDVMRSYAGYGWWGGAASAPRGIGDATNQFAAMPSMHVGWAMWCSIQMWGFGSRLWQALAVAYPTLLTIVVLATGNHFLLDVLAGVACALAAYAIVQAVGQRRRFGDPSADPAAAQLPRQATGRSQSPSTTTSEPLPDPRPGTLDTTVAGRPTRHPLLPGEESSERGSRLRRCS